MAAKKTLDFLPKIFQTDANKKFLSATIDQLIAEPNLTNIHGYIGRKFAPTYKNKDSYILESSTDRQNYQLEPSIVVRNDNGDINFFASYSDLLNKIKYYGGVVTDHNRLFNSEYYSYNPMISLDMFVNFSQYYWLPNGPEVVNVNTSGIGLTKTFDVLFNAGTNQYEFKSGTETHTSLTLLRGGVYTFNVNQPGHNFWIQTEPGIDGKLNLTPNISSRDVLGVTNNGVDVGQIVFTVPQRDAQDRFNLMPTIHNVDYAFTSLMQTPIGTKQFTYKDIHNQTVSALITAYPEFNGIASQLNSKYIAFVDQYLLTNVGEEIWTGTDNITVPESQRQGIWQIQFTGDIDDPTIKLIFIKDILVNEKIYVNFGIDYANMEFYKDVDNLLHPVPLITSLQDQLYFQDGTRSSQYGTFTLVNASGWSINVDTDILGKTTYTSPNGVQFTNGLKIRFDSDVLPLAYRNKEFYVEGVGTSIALINAELLVTPESYNAELALNYPGEYFPEYTTINRNSDDLNPWSRNNRWFHRDVIRISAEYNNTYATYDQKQRASRPIIEFEGNLQLLNNGHNGKHHVDVIDTDVTDAFNQIEGQVLTTAFGVTLFDGLRVIFANDNDPLVRNKIYTLSLVQTQLDVNGQPTGDKQVKLDIADDGVCNTYDTVVVTGGLLKGKGMWFDGTTWIQSQQKTTLQQAPLFDVFDESGASLTTYPRSTFNGTKLFGYKHGIGVNDAVLGFPLSYRNFGTQGDIEFQNYSETDTFEHSINQQVVTSNISIGFFHKNINGTSVKRNIWSTVVEPSKQYQLISYEYDGINSPFIIDVVPEEQASIPYVKVYRNNTFVPATEWTLDNNAILLSATLTVGDKIDILVYSKQISELGFYQVPINLDLNAQNINLESITLGQVRNHLVELSRNTTTLEGDILGSNNIRDFNILAQGGNILQHSAPIPYGSLFLLGDTANFVDATRYAQQEYAKFKNKFLELSGTLTGIQPTDPAASVDLILTTLNSIKNKTFPWYYSDMVPYGALTNTIEYTVFDPFVRTYEITNVFADTTLSNKSVLVYLNDVQLVKGHDYSFNTDLPAVTFNDTVILNVDDVIKFVEYENTDGNYIPETPTKLGLYPKSIPEIFVDDTYRTPIGVLRGHDGSLTPIFGDYRDSFLLELEKRIYNNIKLPDTNTYEDMYAVMPGKFRTNDYTLSEATQLISGSFLTWTGNNKLDFTLNTTFDANDPFTWNYGNFIDRIDGELLPGSWKACFQYFYDTIRPHLTPWEMLGFSEKPIWWEENYGPAPYTGGNTLLWQDLEAGRIIAGNREGIDARFARPGLMNMIPVDNNGFLKNPAEILTASFNAADAGTAWAAGQIGPVESAWRTSSDYPFAVQQALALAKPGKYFSQYIDTSRYQKNVELNQYLTDSSHHIKQTDIKINGNTQNGSIDRTAGYLNWIAEYLTNQGISPATKITPMLQKYEVNLAYKMAGFTDQKYLQVLAEQSSPTSTNDSIIIPNENYKVFLYKSSPIQRIVYSGVIVEKTDNGYSVRGYDLNNPYFTIIPSIVNGNAYKIKVLNSEATVFFEYEPIKTAIPYGHEFKTQQQVADFLVSYERYLMAQGFTFNDIDEQLAEVRNWKLSIKEFLFWAQQGWKTGSVLVLSPVSNTLNAVTVGAITDEISDSQYGSKILDQNFKLVKNNNYNVLRSPTEMKVSLNNNAVIGYAEFNLVQYDHALIFDNATVFNDIIYKPELGNRQFRLKLIGQKTAEWDGSLSAPGFIYNSGVVNTWVPGKDYLKGDLVEFKNQYYTALSNIVASSEFAFANWKPVALNEVKKGLLPNFSSIASKSKSYYDSYGYFNDADQIKYSHGLIGFKPRQYLDDLGLNETTQIELYKGYIKQKGSANAVTQLTNAEFNNLNSAISFYEEWAARVGEYGALDTNPYIEISMDEKAFSINPAVAEFVDVANSNRGNGVTVFNNMQLHKTTEQFNGNIALNRDDHSDYDNDIPTAGYVNIDDVDTTIFDLQDYRELNNQLDQIGTGFTIWTAKDFSQKWNVYRVSETDNQIVQIANALDGYITFTSTNPHQLTENDVFLVRKFDAEFDGFYRVFKVVDLNTVMVEYSGNTNGLSTVDGLGMLFTLDSIRFQYMEDARKYTPKHGWTAGEKIWIDDDAATTVIQGQDWDTANHTWKVYEKTTPWQYNQSLIKRAEDYSSTDGFGESIKMTADGLIAVVGAPSKSTTGVVNTFVRDSSQQFIQSSSILPIGANTSAFGHSLDIGNDTLVVGAPSSNNNKGYVYVYKKKADESSFKSSQIIASNISSDEFGSTVAIDDSGKWLYIGSPNNDKVYVYGLNTHVETRQDVISVNNQNILTLNGNITANVGDSISQEISNATFTITNFISPSSIEVSTLTDVIMGSGNLRIQTFDVYGTLIGTIDTGVIPVSATSTSNTANITLPYEPANTDSLTITTRNRTYIPNIDYVVSGNVVMFGAYSGNVEQNDVLFEQSPYFSYVTTLTGSTGSNFGSAIDTGNDGTSFAVGAPNASVTINGNTFIGAGEVRVYDRVIEAIISDGGTTYTPTRTLGLVYRVTVDNIEVTNYTKVGNSIVFSVAPTVGKIIRIETNEFNLLEVLTGDAVQANAAFGTSLTVCSNSCAIYVGAPYYDAETAFNTGAVFKFHNRGRLYGTNTGTVHNPIFTPGDTIRLDNIEVEITGGLIQTDSANLLVLSESVVATTGQYITQTIGGNIANVTVLANTGSSGSNTITVGGYLDSNVFTYGSGVVSINGTPTTAVPAANLDQVVDAINNANILGVSATNANGYLKLNSNSTVSKNLLQIQSGTNTGLNNGVWYDAGIDVYAQMQIIVNPYNTPGEYFGSKVTLAQNAYMLGISSERGSTREHITFDNGILTLDNGSTGLYEIIAGSGSVYVYELYDDPRNAVEHPGRYSFCQNLKTNQLSTGDLFGHAIDIVGNYILVSAPADDTAMTDAGTVYLFENVNRTRGWNLIRYQEPTVDIESINRLYAYNNLSNTILTNIEFIDPIKGKLLGQAEQEITYKTEYDPAIYNRGNNTNVSFNENLYWNEYQVDEVWWNLSKVRYIDYEQGSLTYRTLNWGRLFPNSTVEILEWVESNVLPSQYVSAGYNGIPKYEDDSAYVEITYVDSITNIISSKYYFWVKDKTKLTPNNPRRKLPTSTIADMIVNPKNQGIPYAAVIKNNAIIVYNIADYLSAQNTILHIDYDLAKNSSIIHSEYELIQKGNPDSLIPTRIVNKLTDSLSGIDSQGAVVPDPTLGVADRIGLNVRPRQSLIIDRLQALTELVEYVNGVFIAKPIAKQYNLEQMRASEPIPSLNEYDATVSTEVELDYLDKSVMSVGYKVLVETDTTQNDLWVIYQLTSDMTWQIFRVQAYKTALYWNYVDWYATGYSASDKATYVAPTLVDALKLSYAEGDIIRISNTGNGEWQLVLVNNELGFDTIGIQNGTIQLDPSLGNYADNNLGFDNQGFSSKRYDQNPNIEIRYIINALHDAIFVNELSAEFNNMFFVMLNYIFNEQKYVDWIFKTSFISVNHQLRALDQVPNYIKDNQTYYQDYINEVKPYSTKVREYLINYNSTDEFLGSVTDFDLPSYYDTDTKVFRSPSGEMVTKDEQLWQTDDYKQWYDNRNCVIDRIVVENPGTGYTIEPIVTITGGGTGSGATARAVIDYDLGTVTEIVLTNPGQNYSQTVTVTVNGNGSGATAYAILKNTQVRSIDTSIKFDRVGYNSTVSNWAANTAYSAGTVVRYNGEGYVVNANITTNSKFIASDYTVYPAANFKNANDRIVAYYNPLVDMPVVETISTELTISANVANSSIVYVNNVDDVRIGMSINGGNAHYANITNVVTGTLLLSAPVTANVGEYITQSTSGANVRVLTPIKASEGRLAVRVSSYKDDNVPFVFGSGNITISNVASATSTEYAIYPIVNNIGYIQVDVPQTFATDSTITATYENLGQVITGIDYPGVQVAGLSFRQQPGFSDAHTFDTTQFDNVEYDIDGNPIVSDSTVDALISSDYTDTLLGTRPEDINVDGGAYIDTYSSHAPEELVPGSMFDTLDMQIHTQILNGSETIGYRIFSNMREELSYLRIADFNSTPLAANLALTDTTISVIDASKLMIPNTSLGIPGVIFVNGERITYYTIDLNTNTLGQIRRGTEGTGTQTLHVAGTVVYDGSVRQTVPNITIGTTTLGSNVNVSVANVYTRTIASDEILGTYTYSDWYNDIGFENSTTEAVLFLKNLPSGYVNLITEDALNTIVTEDNNPIIKE